MWKAWATGILLSISVMGSASQDGEWVSYGREPGGDRHSPLSQINSGNLSELRVAWSYRTGELAKYSGTRLHEQAAFEATPLMKDGVLYFCTPTNRVIALDAGSGKELWTYDPKVALKQGYSEVTSRGVSLWEDARKNDGEAGQRVLFMGTIDGRLVAIDARKGQPVSVFGEKGIVDLKKEAGPVRPGQFQVTSPPALTRDLVIVGASIGDNYAVQEAHGVVRAYHARSGRIRWSWDSVPRQSHQPGYNTWQGETAHRTGAANAWAPLSVDLERDLVFVATSSPSPDYYGGERRGPNLYANSLVALRASSGDFVWGFQAVHHDLWDFDIPMQPILVTLSKAGRRIEAVVFGTKMGHLFALDRATGESIFRNDERAVPQSDVPGEETWKTQLFPAELPLFGLRQVTQDDAWGLTEEDREAAREKIAALRSDGPFTPPSLGGSIVVPSNVGGFHWGGLSYDPARGILVGPVNRIAAVITLLTRWKAEEMRSQGVRLAGEFAPMRGTPYALIRDYLINFEKGLLPMTPPPWGTLAAVDLATCQLRWEVPLGFMLDVKKYPEARQWGSLNLGGALTTAGGLVFIAATVDGHLRAFETETGKLLWESPLPVPAQSTPMTYEWKGKQYLVIAAGGHGKLRTELGDYVLAYALP